MPNVNNTVRGKTVLFEARFLEGLKEHQNLKQFVRKKTEAIIDHPIELGEPLKGNWRGYYSCPVKRGYLVIYTYCKSCRKKADDTVVRCGDCAEQGDEVIRFWAFGVHDKVYAAGPS